ncbi:MAG: hypothetical protein WCE64_07100 [Bacteroidales bacterium]
MNEKIYVKNLIRINGKAVMLFAGICLTGLSVPAAGTPSFARQTGLSCTACHSVFPQLNSFGRLFKLNGYTLTTISTIDDKTANGKNRLKLLSIPDFAVMVQTSFSRLDKELPGTQNNNVELPQQMSLFLSSMITPRIGSFIQVTYDQQGASFGMDNVDIRYANKTQLASKELIYGFTLNNNPTVQDPWNSLPAWGFPYASSPVAPGPLASTVIEGALAQQVAGLGAYGMFNSLVYGEFSLYRSAPQGAPDPPGGEANMIIKGAAPYWRLAVQHQWPASYIEAGTYGLYTKMYPFGVSGLTDKYTDIGFDLQFEYSLSKANLIFHSTWIHEIQELDASFGSEIAANRRDRLNSFKIDGSIFGNMGCGLTLGYYMISGTSDSMLYAPQSVDGSLSGKPDSNGFIMQFNYIPWYNVQFSVQYVINNKFNGARNNYDGSGRNSFDNNSLYLLTWLTF